MDIRSRRVVCIGDAMTEVAGLLDDGWEITHQQGLSGESEQSGAGVLRLREADERRLQAIEESLQHYRYLNWIALVDPENLENASLSSFISNNFFDYHTLPVDVHRFRHCVGHACGMSTLKRQTVSVVDECITAHSSMTGKSEVMRDLCKSIGKVAATDSAVLVTGESGTGKELVAKEIHQRSGRHASAFVAVNCGSLPEKLIQSELFGHEKGAFTGAISRKKGKIEAASGGTIFLDEIGDLPYEAQVNLLRFLQEGTIERVGGTEEIKVDVRVIAATHVDLERAIREGRFREDLFFRLNVLNLHIPPLRQRGDDIELLANSFLERYMHKRHSQLNGFSKQAVTVMRNHHWSGNVRELMNRVQRACVMAEGRVITPADLALESRGCTRGSRVTLDEARREAEKSVILEALFQSNHNIAEASRMLGVSRVTLYRLLDKHHLNNLNRAG